MIRAALLAAALFADTPTPVSFVACPIYRDTDSGRKSGCWLADEPAGGVRYDVTAAPTKPDWNHAILVEGFANAAAGDPCGGTVLDPIRVSVLQDACTRHMVPAEGYKGRRFALPQRNVRPLYDARKRPDKPYVEGRFTIPFDFGSSFITYQISDYYLDATINYALDVAPAKIVIAGHAQTTPHSISGVSLVEPASLAKDRAEIVRRALVMRGIPVDSITIARPTATPFVAAAFDGIASAEPRRVDVTISPR